MVQRRKNKTDGVVKTVKDNQIRKAILGKRPSVPNETTRSSKRSRKTLVPYQAPASVATILKNSTIKLMANGTQAKPIKKSFSTKTQEEVKTKTSKIKSVKKPAHKKLKPFPATTNKLLTKSKNNCKSKNSLSATQNGVSKTVTKIRSKPIKSKKASNDSALQKKPPKKSTRKSKLNPKSNITEYQKDPTYESNESIPHISTLAHSRLLIRAVLLEDTKLLQSLVKDKSKICSLAVQRCISVDKDAFSYAVEKSYKPGIKILLDSSNHEKLGTVPSLMLQNEGTGYGSRAMFGHAMKAVSVARGGKEGNAAFLKDRNQYTCNTPSLYQNVIAKFLFNGVSYETLQFILSQDKDSENRKWSYVFSSIYSAVRGGHHLLAGKLIETAMKRGGFGFNDLHKEALLLTNQNFTAVKSVSVVKKAMENKRITPLHCAAVNPNPKYLAALLSVRPDYNVLDTGNWTLIHYAAVCCNDGNLKLLLSRGISPIQIEKEEGNTPLHLAVKTGRLDCVNLLLKNEKESKDDATDDDNQPALKESLLTKVNKKGKMPIHVAACSGNSEIVTSLLDAGSDINKPTKAQFDKLTPLMIAANAGHLDTVKLLIDRGAKIEVKDRRGRTALMNAVINGQGHVVSYLLRLGANESIKDSSGNGLAHYAAAYGWYFILKLVLEAGCNPNEGNFWKMTPLGIAFLKGHIGIVEMLLKEPGVDINAAVDDESGKCFIL